LLAIAKAPTERSGLDEGSFHISLGELVLIAQIAVTEQHSKDDPRPVAVTIELSS
jgi:hypothetical protein